MRHALVLFDIDGTIMLTDHAGRYAMERVGQKLFGAHFSVNGCEFAGMLDSVIYTNLAKQNKVADHEERYPAFRDAYVDELRFELDRRATRLEVLPGVRESIRALDDREDVMLGLLSGNYRAIVPMKFEALGLPIEPFKITALGDEARLRSDLVALAMQRYERFTGDAAQSDRVFVIGDTPKDVACAKAHDCKAIGVATGTFGVDELSAAGADFVFEDLSDVDALVAAIETSS